MLRSSFVCLALQMARGEESGSLLQVVGRSSWNDDLDSSACPLPENAAWATVHTDESGPFRMAVYAKNDLVSGVLHGVGTWEGVQAASFGPPGHAYDIGANVGFYTFALAHAGWNVTSFEPMPSNLALFAATLCENPSFKDRIDLHEIGLGDKEQHCELFSKKTNFGDGTLNCGDGYNVGKGVVSKVLPSDHEIRGTVDIMRFDDVRALKFEHQSPNFVKIDVEGFECHVWKGAKKLIAQQPKLIQSEVWQSLDGCSPKQYLRFFSKKGYNVMSDLRCKLRGDMNGPPKDIGHITVKDYWFCKGDGHSLLEARTESVNALGVIESDKASINAFGNIIAAGLQARTRPHVATKKARRTVLLSTV